MKRNFFSWLTVLLGVVALVGFGFSSALAEETPAAWALENEVAEDDLDAALDKENQLLDVDPDYGDYDYTCYAIHPLAFQGQTYTDIQKMTSFGQNRYCTSACDLWTSVQLPTGVSIRIVELNAYDGGSSSVGFIFGYLPDNASGGTIVTSGNSTWSSGYGYRFNYINYTVNNYTRNNTLEVNLPGGSTYRLVGMRFYYKRQVSPKPGTATFWDVPTSHPFHQYVEALARSRITSGCGGGAYCVNDPVTRGQMAVFLARTVGLHWPN